jgi:hypothetical protein
MIDRAEAAKIANKLMSGWCSDLDRQLNVKPCDAHHFGKCELRYLMDQIYGGPPASDSEKIK